MLFYAKQRAPIAILTMLALMVISNLWATLRSIDLASAIFIDVRSLIALLAGGVLIVSLDSVIFLVNWMIGFHPFLRAFDRGFTMLFGRISFPAVIAGGLLAALGEETFFRGILQSEIGWIPAALIFALAHVGRGGFNLFALWAIIEGLVFGWLYQLTGNLLVPMVVHGLHDAGGMLFARYFYKRPIPPAETLFDWMHTLSGVIPATVPAVAQIAPAEDSEASTIENA